MRASVEQLDTKLPLEALDLQAECGLSDVLASRSPAEVKLLGQRDEESELTKLQAHRLRAWGLSSVCTPNLNALATAAEERTDGESIVP
jgi:hypothetical protein